MSRTRSGLPLVFLLALLALPGLTPGGQAEDGGVVLRLAPKQEASLPFWCDWGYDWDERCYREDGDRLPIGGDQDKVWRAALRFSLLDLPAGAVIVDASLYLFHDGSCLAPLKTLRPCPARSYGIDAHPILSSDWFDEREVDLGPAVAGTQIVSATRAQWLVVDLTDLVAEWAAGRLRNDGVVLKLPDGQEDYDVSGPKLPSSRFGDPTQRPHLVISYLTG